MVADFWDAMEEAERTRMLGVLGLHELTKTLEREEREQGITREDADLDPNVVNRLQAYWPLVDQDTFDRAQALLKQRGEDLAMRAASRAEFLLTGLVRCGHCRRAYVGMSAKGNGGTYHYYACSGRQKLGRKS